MRWLLAAFLVAHGVAHLVGFVGPWRLSKAVPYTTTLLGGRLDVGDVGIRALGIAWLLAALGFAGLAVAITLRWPGWLPAAAAVTAASLVLSALAWPEARVGVFVDLALLAYFLGLLVAGGSLT